MSDSWTIVNDYGAITVERNSNVFAARLRKLGLTAYAYTEEDALDKLARMRISRYKAELVTT